MVIVRRPTHNIKYRKCPSGRDSSEVHSMMRPFRPSLDFRVSLEHKTVSWTIIWYNIPPDCCSVPDHTPVLLQHIGTRAVHWWAMNKGQAWTHHLQPQVGTNHTQLTDVIRRKSRVLCAESVYALYFPSGFDLSGYPLDILDMFMSITGAFPQSCSGVLISSILVIIYSEKNNRPLSRLRYLLGVVLRHRSANQLNQQKTIFKISWSFIKQLCQKCVQLLKCEDFLLCSVLLLC